MLSAILCTHHGFILPPVPGLLGRCLGPCDVSTGEAISYERSTPEGYSHGQTPRYDRSSPRSRIEFTQKLSLFPFSFGATNLFQQSTSPLSHSPHPPSARARAASARSGNTLKGLTDFYLKAQAICCPLLFRVCHDCSASISLGTLCMLGATSASRSRFRAKQPHKRVSRLCRES